MVAPENLGVTDAWIERLRDAAVTAYETRNDVSIDYRTSTITAAFDDPFFDEDDVFIEAATNPAKLALVRLMLGQGAVHRNNLLILKGATADAPADDSAIFHKLPLHIDQVIEGIPMGVGHICHRFELYVGLHRRGRGSRRSNSLSPRQSPLRPRSLAPRHRHRQLALSARAPRGEGRLGGDLAGGNVSLLFAADPPRAANSSE